MYQTTTKDSDLRQFLSPVQEVIDALKELLPDSSFPEIVMLRSASKLRTRQQCHIDNKEFYHSNETIASYEDISFSCFFGLEESTYLGLATFDPISKQLTREMVHIKPGSMLLITGNMIHYGSMYRGSDAAPGYWYPETIEKGEKMLRDNFRCCAFIHPRNYHTDTRSQFWFADGCDPYTSPHYESDDDDDLVIKNTHSLHKSSNM